MKRFARLLGVTLGLAALAFVVSLVPQKTASGTVAANVNVVNTPDNPLPVKDTRITSSFDILIPVAGSEIVSNPAVPTCPAGTDFLITAVNAAPDFFGNTSIAQLGLWSVRVNVVQRISGGAGSKPILLYGNGPQHLSVTLPAGQPAFFPGSVEVLVASLSGPLPATFIFTIHVSGYCGVAFTTP